MCIEAEELLPGDSNAIFRPMDIDESARPLEGCVLSVRYDVFLFCLSFILLSLSVFCCCLFCLDCYCFCLIALYMMSVYTNYSSVSLSLLTGTSVCWCLIPLFDTILWTVKTTFYTVSLFQWFVLKLHVILSHCSSGLLKLQSTLSLFQWFVRTTCHTVYLFQWLISCNSTTHYFMSLFHSSWFVTVCLCSGGLSGLHIMLCPCSSGYSGVERDCLTHIAGILGAV